MKFGSGYNKVGTEHSLSLSNTRQSSLGQHSIWGGGVVIAVAFQLNLPELSRSTIFWTSILFADVCLHNVFLPLPMARVSKLKKVEIR